MSPEPCLNHDGDFASCLVHHILLQIIDTPGKAHVQLALIGGSPVPALCRINLRCHDTDCAFADHRVADKGVLRQKRGRLS